jgi:hypothetical protein
MWHVFFGKVQLLSGWSFAMLDRRNLAPVGYKRFNKDTGKEVPWDEIVKGYEYRQKVSHANGKKTSGSRAPAAAAEKRPAAQRRKRA